MKKLSRIILLLLAGLPAKSFAACDSTVIVSQALSCTDFLFSTDTTAGGTYSWDFGDGHNAQGGAVVHNFPFSGNYVVTLIAGFGTCSDTVQLTVSVTDTQPPMFPPNVFTPNGDGINDAFVITGLVECTPFVVEIYDRWGQLMFTTEHPVFVHWKGESIDGRPAPEGVYFYVIRSELYTTTGFVSLFR